MPVKGQPIIVIKKRSGHGGHHGGAWKVAYADFVTAMMSLFIVLWLMGSSEKVKKAVAGYFNDPRGTASMLGTTMSGTGETVTAAAADNMQKLKEKLEEEIKARKDLEKLSKQIEITITSEGLRIELLEDTNGTFYEIGSAKLSTSGQDLLSLLAGELKTLPNSLLIEGHTDSIQYSSDASYSNWELSADRANAARRLLQQDGVRSDQVTQVRGYADQLPRAKHNPSDPSNRRVSILVKNQDGPLLSLKVPIAQERTNSRPAADESRGGPGAGEKTERAPSSSGTEIGGTKAAAASIATKTGTGKTGMMERIKGLVHGTKG